MKYRVRFLALLLVILISLFTTTTYSSTLWNFTYDESGDDAYLSVYTHNNLIIATGYSMSQYPLISIFEKDGKKILDKTLITSGGAIAIASTYYNGYIYTTGVVENNKGDIFIAKINPSNGKTIFLKIVGGNGTDEPRGITTLDGKIFIIGNTTSTDGNWVCGEDSEGIILAFDNSGNMLWHKCILEGDTTELNDIYAKEDKLYVIGTVFKDFLSDILLINIDTNGNVLWQTTIGGNDYDYGYGITGNQDNIFISGTTFSDDIPGFHGKKGFSSDGYMAALTYQGKLLWQQAIGGTKDDELFDIGYTFLGPMAVGYTRSSEVPGYQKDEDFFIAYTTDYGKIRYIKAWGGDNQEELWGISISPWDIAYITGWVYTGNILFGNISAVDEDSNIISIPYPFPKAITLRIWNNKYLKGNNILLMDQNVFPFIDPRYNRSLVPIRFIAEGLGFSVKWDAKQRIITIIGNKTIKIFMKDALNNKKRLTVKKPTGEYIIMDVYEGSSTINVNGKNITISTKPLIYNGRTFVPLRFISETLGSTVKWIPPDGVRIIPKT